MPSTASPGTVSTPSCPPPPLYHTPSCCPMPSTASPGTVSTPSCPPPPLYPTPSCCTKLNTASPSTPVSAAPAHSCIPLPHAAQLPSSTSVSHFNFNLSGTNTAGAGMSNVFGSDFSECVQGLDQIKSNKKQFVLFFKQKQLIFLPPIVPSTYIFML